MRPLRFLLASVLVLISAYSAKASFWSGYPRDGKFKQLPAKADRWFYTDQKRWPIKAPDKWQHFSGCYLSQKLLQNKLGKLNAFLLTESVGVLKEIDDGYREGWSTRDLIVDNLGILGALLSGDKIKFIASYDSEKVSFSVHFIIR